MTVETKQVPSLDELLSYSFLVQLSSLSSVCLHLTHPAQQFLHLHSICLLSYFALFFLSFTHKHVHFEFFTNSLDFFFSVWFLAFSFGQCFLAIFFFVAFVVKMFNREAVLLS